MKALARFELECRSKLDPTRTNLRATGICIHTFHFKAIKETVHFIHAISSAWGGDTLSTRTVTLSLECLLLRQSCVAAEAIEQQRRRLRQFSPTEQI